jgi:CopG family nickel-responsive transcriptional regulator
MDKGQDTTRFTVSLPDGLMAELDRRVAALRYPSRSEFIRDLIREKIVEDRWKDEREEVVGVLTISYDHHQRELTHKIMHIQHHRYVNVLCTTHVHMDTHNCLETIIIRGRPPEIEGISDEIAGLRGVRFAKLTRASAVEV